MTIVQIIPIVAGGGPFRETFELDAEEYIFDFSYNQRDGAWYHDILMAGEIIALRLKIVAGYNLLDAIVSLDKPPGKLYLYDAELKTVLGREADIDTLGNSVWLVYEPAEAA